MRAREVNFDGLVGPTYNFGGLSRGNVASTSHGGEVSSPRGAALQGLAKMRFVAGLGVGQAVLPPQPRPSLVTLRRLGFAGTDEQVIARAGREHEQLLRLCCSASPMWTANAATVFPSLDARDGRVHLVPANLQQMFHRSIEAETTTRVLRAIFRDERSFVVHNPLPGGGQLADEGAANHTRLYTATGAVHLLAWGRRAWGDETGIARRHPARQTFEASQALARLGQLDPDRVVLPEQHPEGIDAGAFHTDVLAVGNGCFFMLHELAFREPDVVLSRLHDLLGDELVVKVATRKELPVSDAVGSYPFNSQVLTVPDGSMAIVAPVESQESGAARTFLDGVAQGKGPVRAVHYFDVRQSMKNGGGPACLRLRVVLTEEEEGRVLPGVLFTPELDRRLEAWVNRHHRDRLLPADLADPALARESMAALDELTGILGLGSVYEFQR